MRRKFLSILASFLIVSFVMSSCLRSEEYTYSPDATIHSFSLDTTGIGPNSFTINQITGEIYNQDSLPVGSDTIIDSIRIATLDIYGLVTSKDPKTKEDTLLTTEGYIDFSHSADTPIVIKVWAPDMLTSKEYKIRVLVHRHDPDSVNWQGLNENFTEAARTEDVKAVYGNKHIYALSQYAGKVHTLVSDVSNTSVAKRGNNWDDLGAADAFGGNIPGSMIYLDGKLYAAHNNKLYSCTAGSNDWQVANREAAISHVVAPYEEGDEHFFICIAIENGKSVFRTTKDGVNWADYGGNGETVPDNFPVANYSYTSQTGVTGYKRLILVGETRQQAGTYATDIDPESKTLTWSYNKQDGWLETEPGKASCPALKHPSIMFYDDKMYIFGDQFETFYVADRDGMGYVSAARAKSKFAFPMIDWGNTKVLPAAFEEFRGRSNYAMVTDPETDFIYLLFAGGQASFEEEITVPKEDDKDEKADDKDEDETVTVTRSYNYKAEVVRGRLNQLWFDHAKGIR